MLSQVFKVLYLVNGEVRFEFRFFFFKIYSYCFVFIVFLYEDKQKIYLEEGVFYGLYF